MTLSQAWKKSKNGAASYQYGALTITVVAIAEDELDVRVGNGPVRHFTGGDFGDLLYLLGISPEEGWSPACWQETSSINAEYCWHHEGAGLGGWTCKHLDCRRAK